jgi:glycosyltransferase involved in cell wall biosynthesis
MSSKVSKSLDIGMVIARYPPVVGGTEVQCERLSEALLKMGHHVRVYTEKRSNDVPKDETRNGVRIRRLFSLGNPPFSSLLFVIQLFLRSLVLQSFDILHSHMIGGYGLFLLVLGKCFGTPVLIKIAGGDKTGELYLSQQSLMGKLKLRLVKALARHIVCPSEGLAGEWTRFGFSREVIHCIPNGIDANRFSPVSASDREALRKSLGIAPDRLMVVYAGRSNPGKGVDRLIKAWTKGFYKNAFRWTLLLLTPRDEHSKPFEKDIKDLDPYVKIVYDPKDLLPYYRASDGAVLVSEGEGLSNFLLEAMATGLPLVTTKAAAIGATFQDPPWGWVLPGALPLEQELLTLLTRISEEPDERSAKGAAAREKVKTDYSIAAVAKRYESLYRQMLHD